MKSLSRKFRLSLIPFAAVMAINASANSPIHSAVEIPLGELDLTYDLRFATGRLSELGRCTIASEIFKTISRHGVNFVGTCNLNKHVLELKAVVSPKTVHQIAARGQFSYDAFIPIAEERARRPDAMYRSIPGPNHLAKISARHKAIALFRMLDTAETAFDGRLKIATIESESFADNGSDVTLDYSLRVTLYPPRF